MLDVGRRIPKGTRGIAICATITLGLSIATYPFRPATKAATERGFRPAAVFSTLAAIIALASVFCDVYLRSYERKAGGRFWVRRRMIANQVVGLFAFISVALYIVMVSVNAIRDNAVNQFDHTPLYIISMVTAVSDVALLILIARLDWWPIHRTARSAMLVGSIIQVALAIVMVALNHDIIDPRSSQSDVDELGPPMYFQHLGSLLAATAVLGVAIGLSISEGIRTNALFARFLFFYKTLNALSTVFFLYIMIQSIISAEEFATSSVTASTFIGDSVVAAASLILLAITRVAAMHLQEPPTSNLKVEIMDLASLSAAERRGYARLINLHGRSVPGCPSGDAAISLMLAYTGSSIPKMKCRVLRVYKPDSTKAQDPIVDGAWANLDDEMMILRAVTVDNALDNHDVEKAPAPPKISKKKKLKLAKEKEAAQAAGILPDEVKPEPISAETKLREEAFDASLEATEALVLLTTIDDYDLCGTVKGWAGSVLRRTLGSESWSKLLCVRFGLLAFHWPFRQATFYCSSTRRPVARSAVVLRAIAEWNEQLPRKERSSLILDPTYSHESAERAITPSGWQATPLPPSHIVDLRPYKGKTLPEYLKAIKYRDQESSFRKAEGEVCESADFTPEECAEVMRLWREIANKRVHGDGDTAVLADPDEQFFAQLRPQDGQNDRTLLFLKAGGHTVASCVLFRLGNTITSDLQGLDHEKARPLKAYFVMMQHVIGIALREGRDFVDFGPTTAKPKLDIGCKSVAITGAMFTGSSILSLGVAGAARNFAKSANSSLEKGKDKKEPVAGKGARVEENHGEKVGADAV